jgi:predicted N-formylglutamate amidohydrolase
MLSLDTALLADDEPPPFEILNAGGAGPWVIICDHASNRVPRALGTLGLTDAERARHIGWDIGAASVTRGLAARLDAWAILQNYSRLVIDCNRKPGVESSIIARSENTDVPGNIGIVDAERELRRQAIFDPYHAQIAAMLDARQAAGRRTLIVSMHSFTPIYDGKYRPMQAAVLYHRDPRLSRALFHLLEAEPGLVVGDNEPYHVSDETDYGVPVHAEGRGLPHVEIEVRQDLIEDAAGQAEWVERFARLLPLAAGDLGLLPGEAAAGRFV